MTAPTELLTTEEAATMLRVRRETVYALWHRGCFRGTKVGGRRLWPLRELERYLDRQTKGPPGGKG